ncbi:MAG: L-rhamnose isomerase [Sphaerochaetaceae bacterium]
MYEDARKAYAEYGIDTEQAIERLKTIPISLHCWQGDDVLGFEKKSQALSGGIQTTGNYPGRARNSKELMQDLDVAISEIGGTKRLNLHASYAITKEEVERDELEPRHFAAWVEYARQQHLGLDFNPTFFSHPMVKDNLTLSSPNEEVRSYWIRHGQCCRRIASSFAKELGGHSLCNVWIPDGYKDVPSDRLGPRMRLKESLDAIFFERLEGVIDSVESKVFGIGLESFTVGSNEFYNAYASHHPGVFQLLDNGHFHPTEMVSEKLSALLCFAKYVPLHVTRPVRWDSDHVVLLDDELKEIAKEIVRNDAIERVLIGLDFFDASINRIAAWIIGTRNMQKALLFALLQPSLEMRELQDTAQFTKLMALNEEIKMLDLGSVYDEFCRREHVDVGMKWFDRIQDYERTTLFKR